MVVALVLISAGLAVAAAFLFGGLPWAVDPIVRRHRLAGILR